MKWLKGFKLFQEDIDTTELEVNDSDTTELKAAKHSTNDFKNWIEDFKKKKPQLDSLFKNKNLDKEALDKEVDRLLGDPNKDERNPFLSSYIQVVNDERRLENLMDDMTNDRKSLEQNKSLLNDASDDQKGTINDTIGTINTRLSDTQKSISVLQNDISKNKKELEDKMREQEKDMLDSVNNIEDTRK